MPHLRIGIHTSRSGCLENAANRAHELGANTFQIFSASPRMWRATCPPDEDVQRFRAARERFDLFPLAVHANYLINLASVDPIIRVKSIAAFRGELERAAAIGAEYLVSHPGSCRSSSTDEGIAAFASGLQAAAAGERFAGVTVLLENTVGAGAQLGGKFSELQSIRELAGRLCDLPVAYCLDTCHLYAGGFDIATEAGLEKTLAEVDCELGFDLVKVIHTNDSKGAIGSRLDRHANIGEGNIGADGFERILRHPALRSKPFILETPVDQEGDDRRDLETVKRLAGFAAPRAKRKNAGKGVRLSNNRE